MNIINMFGQGLKVEAGSFYSNTNLTYSCPGTIKFIILKPLFQYTDTQCYFPSVNEILLTPSSSKKQIALPGILPGEVSNGNIYRAYLNTTLTESSLTIEFGNWQNSSGVQTSLLYEIYYEE